MRLGSRSLSNAEEMELHKEISNAKDVWIVKQMVFRPKLMILLTSLLPIILSVVAFTYPVKIDTGVDSIRIRDHPVAETEDAAQSAYRETREFWNEYLMDMGSFTFRRRLQGASDASRVGQGPLAPEEGASLATPLASGGADGGRHLLQTGPTYSLRRAALNLPENVARRRLIKWRLNLVFSMKNGTNIFTNEAVRRIRDMENSIVTQPRYKDFCLEDPSAPINARRCNPPNSLINYFYPSPAPAGEATKDGVIYDGDGDVQQPIPAVTLKLGELGLYWYTDQSFQPARFQAEAIRSDFTFARPVGGPSNYRDWSDRTGSQEREYEAWVTGLYSHLKGLGEDGIRVNFGGEFITEHEIKQELYKDISYAAIGLVLVTLYLWWHTGSAFITTVGLFEILISYPVSYFMYRVVMGVEYTSMLLFLSLFIIMGIGVDDIFVFFDTFQLTEKYGEEIDLVTRLSFTYRKAGGAMLVTSFTSAAAFGANVVSAIPSIRVFGLFLGIMVCVNYLLVVTWFPSCLSWHLQWPCNLRAIDRSGEPGEPGDGNSRRGGCCPTLPSVNFCPASLKDDNIWEKYANVLRRGRYVLVAAFVALAVGMMVTAVGLEAADDVPRFFPDHHNVQVFLKYAESEFNSNSACLECYQQYSDGDEVDPDAVQAAIDAALSGGGGISGGGGGPTMAPVPAGPVVVVPGTTLPPTPAPTAFTGQLGPPSRIDTLAPDFATENSVTFVWGAPSSNGYELTNFEVASAEGGGAIDFSAGATTALIDPAKLTFSVVGLAPSTPVALAVRALSAAGEGEWSESVVFASKPQGVVASPPDPPTGLALVTSTTTSLLVTWVPSADNGAAVFKYTVRALELDRAAGAEELVLEGRDVLQAPWEQSLPALQPDTEYRVEVRAKNNEGVSEWASATFRTLGGMPPSGITTINFNIPDVTEVGARFRVELSWPPPEENGAAITSYSVERRFGVTDWTLVGTVDGAAPSFADGNVEFGALYEYRVLSTNSFGTSEPSAAQAVEIPSENALLPSKVTGLGNGLATQRQYRQLLVAWDVAVAEAGGGDLGTIAYEVGFRSAAAAGTADGGWGGWPWAASDGTSALIQGLDPGVTYDVRVRATNAVGPGEWSDLLIVATAALRAPGPPEELTLFGTAGQSKLAMVWLPPFDTGGFEVSELRYNVQRAFNSPYEDEPEGQNITSLSFSSTGLAPSTPYLFRVQAVNAVGGGVFSWPVTLTTAESVFAAKPGEPIGVRARDITHNGFWIDFDQGAGLAPDGFDIRYRYYVDGGWENKPPMQDTTIYLNELVSDVEYSVQVRAYGAGGESAWAPEPALVVLTDPPNPPNVVTNVSAVAVEPSPFGKMVTISWVEAKANGAAITSYEMIIAQPGDGAECGPVYTSAESAYTMRSKSFTELAANTFFCIRARARAQMYRGRLDGQTLNGPWSEKIEFRTGPAERANQPSDVRVVRRTPRSLELSWAEPRYTGGSPLSGGYYIKARDIRTPAGSGGEVVSWSPTTSAVVRGLEPGVTYTFSVAAVTDYVDIERDEWIGRESVEVVAATNTTEDFLFDNLLSLTVMGAPVSILVPIAKPIAPIGEAGEEAEVALGWSALFFLNSAPRDPPCDIIGDYNLQVPAPGQDLRAANPGLGDVLAGAFLSFCGKAADGAWALTRDCCQIYHDLEAAKEGRPAAPPGYDDLEDAAQLGFNQVLASPEVGAQPFILIHVDAADLEAPTAELLSEAIRLLNGPQGTGTTVTRSLHVEESRNARAVVAAGPRSAAALGYLLSNPEASRGAGIARAAVAAGGGFDQAATREVGESAQDAAIELHAQLLESGDLFSPLDMYVYTDASPTCNAIGLTLLGIIVPGKVPPEAYVPAQNNMEDLERNRGYLSVLAALQPEEGATLADELADQLGFFRKVLQVPEPGGLIAEAPPRTNVVSMVLMFGVKGFDRDEEKAVDPFAVDIGDAIFDESFDITASATQLYIDGLCQSILEEKEFVEGPDRCFMNDLKAFITLNPSLPFANNGNWPIAPSRFNEASLAFLRTSVGSKYRTDVGFTIETWPKIKWMRFLVSSKLDQLTPSDEAKDQFDLWEEYMERIRPTAPASVGRITHTCDIWVRMTTEIEAVRSTKVALLVSAVCCVVAVVVFTGNLSVAALTLFNLVGIVATMLALFHLWGWRLGAVEAISITVLVGLSTDFTLHIAEAYSHSPFFGRQEMTVDAIQRIGKPIVSAAVTTILSVLPLLFTTIMILKRFGMIIAACISLSILFGLHLFCPILMIVGPEARLPPAWLAPAYRLLWSGRRKRAALFMVIFIPVIFAIESMRVYVLIHPWMLPVYFIVILALLASIRMDGDQGGLDRISSKVERRESGQSPGAVLPNGGSGRWDAGANGNGNGSAHGNGSGHGHGGGVEMVGAGAAGREGDPRYT